MLGQSDPDAERAPALFYRGLDYGTQRTFNPLSVVVNTGFDVFQFTNHDIRFVRHGQPRPGLTAGRIAGVGLGHVW